jgi:hypothetical protein
VVGALTGVREVAARDHLGQVGRGLQVGQLQPARRAHPQQVGVAADDAEDPVLAPDRDRLDPHRHLVAPLRVPLADDPLLAQRHVEQRPPAVREEGADEVVDVRRRAGRRTHLRARPETGALAVREPEHEVREGEVGDDLPVGDQQVQPGDVLVAEVRVSPGQLGQRRHGLSLGRRPCSDRFRP